MSATACVSAALPDLQHQIVSCTRVSLSVTRFAMYAPVVVRESAPAKGKPLCQHGRPELRRDKVTDRE